MSGEENLARDGKRGCPVTVWDGPYSTRCGAGAAVGKCAHHGPFATAAPTPSPDPTYRPGDIAMVDGKPAVWLRLQQARQDGSPIELWRWMDGDWRWWTSKPAEVGPVLANVADIAAKAADTDLYADIVRQAREGHERIMEARVQPDSRPAETQHNRRSGRDVQEAP